MIVQISIKCILSKVQYESLQVEKSWAEFFSPSRRPFCWPNKNFGPIAPKIHNRTPKVGFESDSTTLTLFKTIKIAAAINQKRASGGRDFKIFISTLIAWPPVPVIIPFQQKVTPNNKRLRASQE